MKGKNLSSLIYTVPAAGALGGEQHCCSVRPPTDLTLCSAPLQKQGTVRGLQNLTLWLPQLSLARELLHIV
jgi:hypothetical protein